MTSGMISVIVPIYKVEPYLNICVESIVNQTYHNLEIILVDDGSPDGCPHLCDEWERKDSRIRVVHKRNGGLSSARNAGLALANGEFISFIDSDDYIDPFMLEELIKPMANPKVGIVECGLYEVTKHRRTVRISHCERMSPEEALRHLLLWDGLVGSAVWNKLFRSRFIHKLRFFEDIRYGEDTPFVYQALGKTEEYVQIPYVGYYHLMRGDSLVGNAYRSYKIQSLHMAKWVAREAAAQEPNLTECAICHIAMNACGQLDSILSVRNGKEIFRKEYREVCEAMRSCDHRAVKRNVAEKQYLRWWLCRYLPDVYGVLKRCRIYLRRDVREKQRWKECNG